MDCLSGNEILWFLLVFELVGRWRLKVAFLLSSMIVRLVGEIECKGIRDQKNTPVEVRGFPGPKRRTWATQSFSDGRRWAPRPPADLPKNKVCHNHILMNWSTYHVFL